MVRSLRLAMSYATMVLLVGTAVVGAALIAQWRLLDARPEHLRTERLRGALYLALLFASFAALHRYVTRAEREEEPCCLTVFEGTEKPGSDPRSTPSPPPPPPPATK